MFTGGGIEIERLGIPNAHFVSVSLDLELEHRITSDIDGVKKCLKYFGCSKYSDVILHIIPIEQFRAPQLMNDDYRGGYPVYISLYCPRGRHDPRGPPRPVARPLESSQPVPPGDQAPRTPGRARTPGRPQTPETPPPEPMEQPEFPDLIEILEFCMNFFI